MCSCTSSSLGGCCRASMSTRKPVWNGLARPLREIAPRIASALAIHAELQAQLDDWHRGQRGRPRDATAYRRFLGEIGCIVPVGADYSIDTNRIDPEIAEIAGPQLLVRVSNARHSLKDANARWVRCMTPSMERMSSAAVRSRDPYDAGAGAQVVAWVRCLLDDIFPLASGSRADARGYRISGSGSLEVILDQGTTVLAQRHALTGYTGAPSDPVSLLLSNRGLGVILEIDRDKPVGAVDAAGIKDEVIESAVIVPPRDYPHTIRSTYPSRGAFEQEAHGHEIHRGGGE